LSSAKGSDRASALIPFTIGSNGIERSTNQVSTMTFQSGHSSTAAHPVTTATNDFRGSSVWWIRHHHRLYPRTSLRQRHPATIPIDDQPSSNPKSCVRLIVPQHQPSRPIRARSRGPNPLYREAPSRRFIYRRLVFG